MQNRDPFPPEKRAELFSTIKKLREGALPPPLGKCMYWGEVCTDPPIGSHSLSKCWLETIMCEGHVLKLVLDLQKDAQGHLKPTGHPDLLGWKEASVFQGFCNKHDTILFNNLDTLSVAPTVDDCMRLVYRSVCREAAGKHHIVDVFSKMGMGQDERGLETLLPEIAYGLRLFRYKFEIEALLNSGDYGDFDHLVFPMHSRPHLLGTTTFMPLVTARGRVLGLNPGFVTLSVLPTETSGLAILSWNRIDNPWGSKFAQSLRRTPPHELGMAISRILIEVSDSTFFAPLFWVALTEEEKLWIIDTHFRSIRNGETIPPADALVPDPRHDGYFSLPTTEFYCLA